MKYRVNTFITSTNMILTQNDIVVSFTLSLSLPLSSNNFQAHTQMTHVKNIDQH